MATQLLDLDLDGLDLEEIEVFVQEGSRGMPEFSASCGTTCVQAGSSSCTSGPTTPTEPTVGTGTISF
ncbi:MAG TPA: hypothetical protein VF625_12830 [Longimicrobium sp.]|jgi:hypothetical protein